MRGDFLISVINNIENSIIVIDLKGKILFHNNKVKYILGQSPNKDVIGANLIDITVEKRKKTFSDLISFIKSSHEPGKTFFEFNDPENGQMYLEVGFSPIINTNNDLISINIISRDLTKEKIFETKLVNSANEMINLIKNANAIIIGLDSRGYITEWNKMSFDVTGYEHNEVYAEKIDRVLLDNKSKASFLYLLNRVLEKGPVANFEVEVNTKLDSRKTLLLSATPKLNSSNQTIGITLVGQDITELTAYRTSLEKMVEERTTELREAMEKEKEILALKERFVSIASHEFRVPLSSIAFSANFIKSNLTKLSHEELTNKLNNVEKLTKHMTYLLDDVLTYGKTESGKIQLMLSEIDIEELVYKLIEDLASSRKKSHRIVTRIKNVPKTITTDETLLRSILTNLLSNAIKFSPDNKEILLEVTTTENMLHISVKDQGIGISEDEINMIFEPFLRSKYVNKIQGTGLGLSIVKKSVELLNGEIKVVSELNKGTTFTVTFPHTTPLPANKNTEKHGNSTAN